MLHLAHQHLQLFPGGFKLRRSFGDTFFEFLLEHLQFLAMGNQIQKHLDLCPKNGCQNGHTHVIDRTCIVTMRVGPVRTAQMPKQK